MNTENNKQHYKMYKAGRRWLFAAVTAFTITGGLVALGQAEGKNHFLPGLSNGA
ncbi:KxYKxGKxW signal peptide domain-containing protein [Fructobacillus sp. W13]|uniref:KxYKxGKxW signal peptide domain-containing protein n=1 Tax=Fructobacillus apis TaxID=2935017 RepID=A0ABT0ZR42_9LACO|nr:KxYKxGKxW signal peptide domain-containing protein [Fructobacillus apis]MCO0832464.1 KxYKxGKxW signal peptide domain-containing protein [Fructobacillus apis]